MKPTRSWVARLRGDTETRDAAITELRDLLVKGLSQSVASDGSGLHADDVAQDALLKILDSLDQFQGRSKFTTWAMTIATHIGISQLRRKHFQDVSLDSITDPDGLRITMNASDQGTVDGGIERSKILALLEDLIETELSERQRTAMRAMLRSMPVSEIARLMGSNRNAVYKLIHDARTKLRAGFERSDILHSDVESSFS